LTAPRDEDEHGEGAAMDDVLIQSRPRCLDPMEFWATVA
jgi:hypothetical protein